MLCPKCNKNIYLTEQIRFWDKNFASDVYLSEAILMLDCQSCDKQIGTAFFDGMYRTPKQKKHRLTPLKRK